MKKLIYIIALFVSTFAFSQISGKLIPDGSIPTAKIIGGVGGGESNPNIVIVTTEAALYNVANANKILDIQSNITLTANRTLASNVTLNDGGGSIISGGYTLTGSNTKINFQYNKVFLDFYTGTIAGTWNVPQYFDLINIGAKKGGEIIYNGLSITLGSNIVTSSKYTFTSADIGKKCAIVGAGTAGKVHNATITAVSPNVTLSSNATSTVSNVNGTVSWDNQTSVRNALFLLNQSNGSHLSGIGETYFHSTILLTAQDYQDPENWTISGYNNQLMNVIFQLIPHDLNQTETLVVDKATNITLQDVFLKGDRQIHGTEGIGKTEGNQGFAFRTLSKNIRAINCRAYYFYGDGGLGKGDNQFMNYIDGTNFITGNTASQVAVGSINRLNGSTIDTGDTSKIYTTSFLDLDNSNFDRQYLTDYPSKSYILSGRSESGWGGLRTPNYTAFYYDEAGTTLLYVSKIQYIYDEIPILDEWKKVKFEFDSPINIADIELMCAPRITALGLHWIGGELSYNGRDGFSNPPRNTTFENVNFYGNGYLTEGPGAGMNGEDMRRALKNVSILNCKFRDNWIDISFIGAENILIQGNTLLASSRDISAAPTDEFDAGITSALGRNVRIIGNTAYEKLHSIDRQDLLIGNTFKGGELSYSANDNTVTDNDFIDIYFRATGDTSADRVGYPTLIKNNKIKYTKNPGTAHFIVDKNKAAIFKDNDFWFNYYGNWSFAATNNSNIQLGENGEARLFPNIDIVTDFGGYWEGNTIRGAKPPVDERDYATGNAFFPLNNFNNNTIDTSLEVKLDLVDDYYTKNNTINGFVNFTLDYFPSSISGTAKVISQENWKIIVNDDYDWTNNGSALVKTSAKYVDFKWINCVFDLQRSTSVNPTVTNKFFKFLHLGKTLFDTCIFKSITPINIDFTDTGIFGSLDTITIIDPICTNITFTKRSGDKILFTKASPLMATYATFANDAAAASAGYPAGYMYMTSTGEYRVKL